MFLVNKSPTTTVRNRRASRDGALGSRIKTDRRIGTSRSEIAFLVTAGSAGALPSVSSAKIAEKSNHDTQPD